MDQASELNVKQDRKSRSRAAAVEAVRVDGSTQTSTPKRPLPYNSKEHTANPESWGSNTATSMRFLKT